MQASGAMQMRAQLRYGGQVAAAGSEKERAEHARWTDRVRESDFRQSASKRAVRWYCDFFSGAPFLFWDSFCYDPFCYAKWV